MTRPQPDPQPDSGGEEQVLHHIALDLAPRFAHWFSRETVEKTLHDSYVRLAATARVRQHLPMLAQKFTRDRLRALARAEGIRVPDRPEVLFVCVHNAGRSLMAAAILDHHAEGYVTVRSAGSMPAGQIDPAVAAVIEEVGLDLSKEFPKPLTDEVVEAADVVITMGCGDACPIFPGKRYLNWELADPAGQPVDDVRAIRDQIDTLVKDLLDELFSPTS